MGFNGLAGLVLLAAFLPLAATAATVTVQSGETLSEIADRYGVSTRQLMRLNGLRYSDYIEAGSRLKIPGPQVNAGPGRHRVQPGDTLGYIAALYRVSSRDLLLMNGLRTPFVVAGENLNMPLIGGILRSLGAFFIRRPAGAQGRALRACEIVTGACLRALEAVFSVM